MRKRSFLLVVIVLIIVIGALALTACNGVSMSNTLTSKGISYTLHSNAEYEVTAFNANNIEDLIVIPCKANNRSVTGIGQEAFSGCPMQAILLPSTIKTIGEDAFAGCDNLTSVFFNGDEQTWNAVVIGSGNSALESVTVYFYSETEVASGNFWYFIDNQPTVWTTPPPQYTISFHCNDGSEVAAITGEAGVAVTAPANPTKASSIFGGWYTDNNTFNHAYTFSEMPSQNLNLYAKWIPLYTITFQTNGGSAVAPITSAAETALTVPSAPTQDGKIFFGWYTDNNYCNKFNFTTMPANNLTLYAKWVVLGEGYFFVEVEGGTGSGIYAEGDKVAVSAEVPLDKELETWQINGQDYTTYTNFYYTVSENLVIHACYQDKQQSGDNEPSVVPQNENPLDAYDIFTDNNYPFSASAIREGYDELYIGSIDLLMIDEINCLAFAIYDDDQFILEIGASYEDHDDNLGRFWGQITGGELVFEGGVNYTITDDDYMLSDEYVPDDLYEITLDHCRIQENYVILGPYLLCNIDYEGNESNAVHTTLMLEEGTLSCPVGGQQEDIVGSIMELDYYLTQDIEDDAEIYYYFANEVCGALVMEYVTPTLLGFDSSEQGLKQVTTEWEDTQYEFDIYYFLDTDVRYAEFDCYSYNDVVIFDINENDLDDVLSNYYEIYVDYYNDDWDYIPVTLDMVSGLSVSQVGKFTMTISYGGFSEEFDYYVTDGLEDNIIEFYETELYISLTGELSGTIFFSTLNDNQGVIASQGFNYYGYYLYEIDMEEALDNEDLEFTFDTQLTGKTLITVTYQGYTQQIKAIVYDPLNPQILNEEYAYDNPEDTPRKDEIIYINENGEVVLISETNTTWYMDNGEVYGYIYNTDECVPLPKEYYANLDLASVGTQAVKIYCINDTYDLDIVVYHGDLPITNYKIVMEPYIAQNAEGLDGDAFVEYYSYYFEDSLPVSTQALTIDMLTGLDVAVTGWQQVFIYLSEMDQTVTYEVYVYDPLDPPIVEYSLYIPEELIPQSEALEEIKLVTHYADGTESSVSIADAPPELLEWECRTIFFSTEAYLDVQFKKYPDPEQDEWLSESISVIGNLEYTLSQYQETIDSIWLDDFFYTHITYDYYYFVYVDMYGYSDLDGYNITSLIWSSGGILAYEVSLDANIEDVCQALQENEISEGMQLTINYQYHLIVTDIYSLDCILAGDAVEHEDCWTNSDGTRLIKYTGDQTSYTVEEGVQTIGNNSLGYEVNTLVIPSSVVRIGLGALYGILDIYYVGNEQMWEAVDLMDDYLWADIYYYSETEIEDGCHWRYVEGVPTIW